MIDREDRAGGFGGELDCPLLRGHQVKDAIVGDVENATLVVVLGTKS